MTRILLLPLTAALLLAGTVLSGQGKTVAEPFADFGISDPVNGKIKGFAGNVSIRTGAGTAVINGPFGARALKFSGEEDALCRFLSPRPLKMDRDFSIRFSIRLDSEPGRNVDTGLGMKLDSWNFSFGNAIFSLKSSIPLKKGKWSDIVFSYSPDRGEAKLYQDGCLSAFSAGRKLPPLDLTFGPFGKFNGAIASLRIWDYAADESAILEIPVDGTAFSELASLLEAEAAKGKCSPALLSFLKNTQDTLAAIRNRKTAPIQTVEDARDMGINALKLAKNAWKIGKTSLADAPFALLEVQPVSPYLRNPKAFPDQAELSANLRVAAAKNEYEPFSFIIVPYRDIDNFTVTISDFQSKKGNVIPASAVDRKILKYRYRASWGEHISATPPVLAPDLLVNDDTLIVCNEIEQKNYLRTKTSFQDISAAEIFDFCKAGVRDADSLQPLRLTRGIWRQFWFTLDIPKDAKPGLYTAQAKALSAGKKIANFTVTLRVYPFELPSPKTSYDLTKDYLAITAGTADLFRYTSLTNASAAEKLYRADLENLKKHGILRPAIPAPGIDRSLFEKDLLIRKGLGLLPKDTFIAAFPDDGTLITLLSPDTPARIADFSAFSERTDFAANAFSRIAGHKDFFFYGVDEGAGEKRSGKFRDLILKKGGKLMTSGWEDNALFIRSADLMHLMPGSPDDFVAEKWHSVRARLLVRGTDSSAVSDPDAIRRMFGMKTYRADYDGFFLPAAPDTGNPWRDHVSSGVSRNQMLFCPALSGPVNTIAFEALREGIDDVRYLTLLRSLLAEAFASNNMDAIYAAKKAVSVFELTDTSKVNLDLLRMELADHITVIMKRLGKDVK